MECSLADHPGASHHERGRPYRPRCAELSTEEYFRSNTHSNSVYGSARGGTRTRTPFRAMAFEAIAAAENFATRAGDDTQERTGDADQTGSRLGAGVGRPGLEQVRDRPSQRHLSRHGQRLALRSYP